jgi:hypothetical protein
VKHTILLWVDCLLVSGAGVAQSPPIGAEVQSWSYDPSHNPPLVTLKVVNTSHRDISAFNISIKEAYANGREEQHEMLVELLGYIIEAKELEGTSSADAAYFRSVHGDGAFHPGEVRNEKLPVQSGLTNYQAVIDVVTYTDGTSDAPINKDALQRIIDERQATADSEKMAMDIIQKALADPNDADPAATAAKQIQDRVTAWRAQQHTKLDIDDVRLEQMANELSSHVHNRDALKQYVSKEQARMSIHAAFDGKTGGQQ